jgi:alkylhydroperoxidase family enzyme
MKNSTPPKVQLAVNSLLTKPGVLTPELRQAIEARAATLSGGERERREVPADLLEFIDKVVLSPHKIKDADFQRLIQSGYSEDAIFELTLCAAVGAGLARIERGLLALRGLSVGERPGEPEQSRSPATQSE